jgi:hypothetical protein
MLGNDLPSEVQQLADLDWTVAQICHGTSQILRMVIARSYFGDLAR